MEEIYWKQFWETGNVTDYLAYKNISERNISGKNISRDGENPESEETIESDYSDRDGFAGVTYR